MDGGDDDDDDHRADDDGRPEDGGGGLVVRGFVVRRPPDQPHDRLVVIHVVHRQAAMRGRHASPGVHRLRQPGTVQSVASVVQQTDHVEDVQRDRRGPAPSVLSLAPHISTARTRWPQLRYWWGTIAVRWYIYPKRATYNRIVSIMYYRVIILSKNAARCFEKLPTVLKICFSYIIGSRYKTVSIFYKLFL